jgi:hypothetical protein
LSEVTVKVALFDPAFPFEIVTPKNPSLQSWNKLTIITKELRERFPLVPDAGFEEVPILGGMNVRVPYIEIGIKIGTIKIEKTKVAYVDSGWNEIILGEETINKAFEVGKHEAEDVSVSSAVKEDGSALSIELYPVQMPFDVRKLERFLRYQRRLYNIVLIAERQIAFENELDLENAIEGDVEIPREFVLQLSAIDSGSIWISLKSGALSTLKRLASVFDTSTSAKLAQQLADARKAETAAEISSETRMVTVARIAAEQERLRAENIGKSYESWRKDARASLKFIDDLLRQTTDDGTRSELIKKKDEAILALADQQMLPIVRNLPQPPKVLPGLLLLPRTD